MLGQCTAGDAAAEEPRAAGGAVEDYGQWQRHGVAGRAGPPRRVRDWLGVVASLCAAIVWALSACRSTRYWHGVIARVHDACVRSWVGAENEGRRRWFCLLCGAGVEPACFLLFFIFY